MAIIVGRGASQVRIEGALADGLVQEVRDALGPDADEMDRVADLIVARAQAQWPVKSGKSRDGWRTDLRVQPGSFDVEVFISNPVPYTRFISSTKVRTSDDAVRPRSPFQTLVRVPARQATRELKKTLPGIIARVLEAANG